VEINNYLGENNMNFNLEIFRLDGSLKFKVPGGYIKPTGYTFQNKDTGAFLGFTDFKGPYIPVGGKRALEKILADGGFINSEGMVWLYPM
jgi:hypothetical protein